jgi:hypothetical protein
MTDKVFEFAAYPKRVKNDTGTCLWKMKVHLHTFPEKAVPSETKQGSLVFVDSKELYNDMKTFAPTATLPAEYFTCNYELKDAYLEFTGKTETCLRLGMIEYMKQYFPDRGGKQLKMNMNRTWNVSGYMRDPESESEGECVAHGIFDDEEDW